MNVIRDAEFDKLPEKTAVCLGFFDGVHRGHQAVLSAAVSNNRGWTPAVFSFEESPQETVTGKAVPRITGQDQKLKWFEYFSIQTAVIAPFSRFESMPPEDFFDFLIRKLNAGMICAGQDFRFGKNRAGDVSLIEELCRKNRIACHFAAPVLSGEEKISSTAVRLHITSGQMLTATEMLGHSFAFRSEVISGNKRGRELGFPTINQPFPPDLVQPKRGVYLSRVTLGAKSYPAVSNVGIRPSVQSFTENGPPPILCETHIFQYSGDLYGAAPETALIHFLRPEEKFGSLTRLRQAVHRDMQTALRMHEISQNGTDPAALRDWK